MEQNKLDNDKLSEELFRWSTTRRQYKYIDLDGEEKIKFLSEDEKLSKEKCAIDGTYLIKSLDFHRKTDTSCACCGQTGFRIKPYEDEGTTETMVIKDMINYAHRLEQKIENLKGEASRLELIANLIQTRNPDILERNRTDDLYNKKEYK